MAKSYTVLRNLYGVETKNTSAANLLYGDQMMNDFHRKLLSKADWPFLQRLRTATTVASTTFVNLPYDVDQVESVFVTVANTRYNPKPAPSRGFWDKLHYTTQTSDTPEYWFVYDGQIGLWPRPSSAGNTISLNAKVRVTDLNTADITTSTITTLANGSAALEVSAGFTTQMAGFWIRPTFSTTANNGDGLWYEISGITDATNATLSRNYGGVSITAGTADSTISQMPLLPESAHDLLPVYAAFRYWSKEKDSRKDDLAATLSDGVRNLFETYALNDVSMVLDDGSDDILLNPNLTITL